MWKWKEFLQHAEYHYNSTEKCSQWVTWAVFPKSHQHVCFVRCRIQMSDVGFVKIINIWCLSVQFGRRSMKFIREDCMRIVSAKKIIIQTWDSAQSKLSKWHENIRNLSTKVKVFSWFKVICIYSSHLTYLWQAGHMWQMVAHWAAAGSHTAAPSTWLHL